MESDRATPVAVAAATGCGVAARRERHRCVPRGHVGDVRRHALNARPRVVRHVRVDVVAGVVLDVAVDDRSGGLADHRRVTVGAATLTLTEPLVPLADQEWYTATTV